MDSSKNRIKAIFITKETGEALIQYVNDSNMHTELLSAFISGLFLFGKESVRKIQAIFIKGPDLEIFVVNKHDLILTAIFSAEMQKVDLSQEAEQVLDLFYEQFCDHIKNWNGCIDDFQSFKTVLERQIQKYFENLEQSVENKSFWTHLIQTLKRK